MSSRWYCNILQIKKFNFFFYFYDIIDLMIALGINVIASFMYMHLEIYTTPCNSNDKDDSWGISSQVTTQSPYLPIHY